MLWTTRRAALGSLVILCLAAAVLPPAIARPGSGLETLVARAGLLPRVGAPVPATRRPLASCEPGGQTQQCYGTGGPHEFVNVGTFFDRRRRTLPNDYMVKYFAPDTPGRYQITGFTFTNNRPGILYPSAGVVTTSVATPNFPTAEQLLNLQVFAFEAPGEDSTTCVDLTGRGAILESDQAAWLVVHLPADTAFVGLRADHDSDDKPCDFMTRDGGEYWYRPDPRQSTYDWEITPQFIALPSRARLGWSDVKRLYR